MGNDASGSLAAKLLQQLRHIRRPTSSAMYLCSAPHHISLTSPNNSKQTASPLSTLYAFRPGPTAAACPPPHPQTMLQFMTAASEVHSACDIPYCLGLATCNRWCALAQCLAANCCTTCLLRGCTSDLVPAHTPFHTASGSLRTARSQPPLHSHRSAPTHH